MRLPLLPIELIHKILIMREPHAIAKILKTPIWKYNQYVNFFQAMCHKDYELDIKFKTFVKLCNLDLIYLNGKKL